VVAVGAGSLAACSASGGVGGPIADRDRTTTSTSSTPTTSSPTTTTGGPTTTDPGDGPRPDAAADDIPDDTYPGLGDPRIDVDHYDVVVRSDPEEPTITGTATLTLAPRTAGPLASFTLDLRGPRVTEATVDGRPATVRPAPGDGAEITITPARPLQPGRDAEVVIRYAGRPRPTNTASLGLPIGWQSDDEGGTFALSEPDGTASWVPVNDHPSDKATWTITLDTGKGLTGIANGRLRSSATTKGGRRRWVWEQDRPMASYLALVAVGRYDLVRRPGPAGSAVVFAFPDTLGPAARKAFDELDPILEYFAATFGPYPDDDAGAIVVPTSLGVALENQTRPLFGLDAVDGDQIWALAHELAHQWFGDAVSISQWHDLWLNEGFATYADWLYLDHTGEVPMAELAEEAHRNDRGTSNLAILDPRAAASFDPLIYERGALTLHALRLTVGDEDFFAILRSWFRQHTAANATSADFIELVVQVGGPEAGALVDRWLHAVDLPALPR
jgi:aminopeptidase N